MQKANLVITLALAGLAVLSWIWLVYRAYLDWRVPSAYMVLSGMITVCACLGWVLVTRTTERRDGETRCRTCGYILRGLSEPRCPECGTPI